MISIYYIYYMYIGMQMMSVLIIKFKIMIENSKSFTLYLKLNSNYIKGFVR